MHITNESRKKQIKIGNTILEYFDSVKQKAAANNPNATTKKEKAFCSDKTTKIGRPVKNETDKVRVISFKLSPEYIEKIEAIPMPRNFTKKTWGMPRKIMRLFDMYMRMRDRENQQLSVLKNLLENLKKNLVVYAGSYKRSEKVQKNQQIINEMNQTCNQIRIVFNLLKFEIDELEAMLGEDEYRNLEFALNWNKRNGQ